MYIDQSRERACGKKQTNPRLGLALKETQKSHMESLHDTAVVLQPEKRYIIICNNHSQQTAVFRAIYMTALRFILRLCHMVE